MTFNELLNINSVCIDTESQSKTAVLLNLSKVMHNCNQSLDEKILFDAYIEREKLGSTAIGHGILIPHICLASINKTYGCFIKLKKPVDFNADDKQPVDLIFGLASATNSADQHLQVLSKIVTKFSNIDYANACRSAENQQDLLDILTLEQVAVI